MTRALRLEPVTEPGWLQRFIVERWGEPGAVSRGRLWTGADLRAIRALEREALEGEALEGEALAGVVSWAAEGPEWEVVTLDALKPRARIGTRLLEAVVELARRAGARRLWLITTNDNLDALRFYQRRGWRLAALHVGVLAEGRRIKPGIPEIGSYGIPIRDEIELEFPL